MPDFSLADVQAVVTEQYKPSEVDLGEAGTCRLVQTTRLSDDKLEEMMTMLNRFKELRAKGQAAQDPGAAEDMTIDDVKQIKRESVEVIENIFRIVAVTEHEADRLIAACNHDMLVLMEVFKRYQKRTQLGEASASPENSETTAGPLPTTSPTSTDSTSGT